jgi:hypothetical protein
MPNIPEYFLAPRRFVWVESEFSMVDKMGGQ